MILAVLMGLLTVCGGHDRSCLPARRTKRVDTARCQMPGQNAAIPALFVIGVGVLCFGLAPRYTAIAGYTVLGWSFLISLLSSGIKLNHWINDTSILTHVSFAPAAPIAWNTNSIIVALSSGLHCDRLPGVLSPGHPKRLVRFICERHCLLAILYNV